MPIFTIATETKNQKENKMKVLKPGHRYELPNFENKDAPGQILQFIEKERKSPDSNELVTVSDGTTNEAVLTMLIDRLTFLQDKASCRENAIVITKLEEALMWLESRTRARLKRGVEGTAAK